MHSKEHEDPKMLSHLVTDESNNNQEGAMDVGINDDEAAEFVINNTLNLGNTDDETDGAPVGSVIQSSSNSGNNNISGSEASHNHDPPSNTSTIESVQVDQRQPSTSSGCGTSQASQESNSNGVSVSSSEIDKITSNYSKYIVVDSNSSDSSSDDEIDASRTELKVAICPIQNQNRDSLVPLNYGAAVTSQWQAETDSIEEDGDGDVQMDCSDVSDANSLLSDAHLADNMETTIPRELPNNLKMCAVCLGPGTFVCGKCYKTTYCCEAHQQKDWETHQQACEHFSLYRTPSVIYRGPFNIAEKNKTFQMIASAKVSSGAKIVEEKPFLISPWPRTALRQSEEILLRGIAIRCLTCFGCCKYIGFNFTECGLCSLPVCSLSCKQMHNHLNNECKFVSKIIADGTKCKLGIGNFKMDDDVKLFYTDVMILRLLLKLSNIMKEQGQAIYEQLWNGLCLTWKIKEKERTTSSKTGMKIHGKLQEYFPLSWLATKGDSSVIWKLYCIIESNSFRFDLPYRRFNVLCTVLNQANNSCQPNCHVFLQECTVDDYNESELSDITVVMRTGMPLTKGEALTFSYGPLVLGTRERRQLLLDSYLTWCECQRCRDPKECGTHASSIMCRQCNTGIMVPPTDILNCDNPKAMRLTDMESGRAQWVCEQHPSGRCRRSPLSVNRSIIGPTTTQFIADRQLKSFEDESLTTIGKLNEVHFFIRSNKFRNRVNTQTQTQSQLVLPDSHYIFLKLYDDILRGALYPLSDLSKESLKDFDGPSLTLIKETKEAYTSFMKIVNPGFQFEGFPLPVIDLMINESFLKAHDMEVAIITERSHRQRIMIAEAARAEAIQGGSIGTAGGNTGAVRIMEPRIRPQGQGGLPPQLSERLQLQAQRARSIVRIRNVLGEFD